MCESCHVLNIDGDDYHETGCPEMKLLNLRKKLSDAGLVLLKDGKGWLVTNNGTVKTLSEKKFADLDAVQMWFESPARRLSEQESDEFDDDWAKFCLEENKNWRK